MELKPCPFCGGEAAWVYDEWNEETRTGDDGVGAVVCQVCHVSIRGYWDEDAAERWNKRTPP